jgi:hypothetical protein
MWRKTRCGLEEILFGFLQFHNKAVAFFAFAVNIKHCAAVHAKITELIGLLLAEVFDSVVLGQQAVEEIDEQVLIHLFPKELFEAEIGKGVDVEGLHVAKIRGRGQLPGGQRRGPSAVLRFR